MKKINNMKELQQEMLALQFKKRSEVDQLKATFDETKQLFAPKALLRDGFKDVIHDKQIRTGLLDGVLSLTTGFLTKKAIVGSSGGLFRQLLGMLVQTGATSAVYQNKDSLKARILPALTNFIQKLKIN